MFCGKCGHKLDDDSQFCINCGSRRVMPPVGSVVAGDSLVQKLISKIWAEIIAWGIVVVVQFVISGVLFSQGGENVVYGIVVFTLAVFNVKAVFDDYAFINQIRQKPVGIVKKYESLTDVWVMLLFSISRGVGIGLIVWIFTMLTRSFVLDNKQGFLELESQKNN